MRDLVFAKQFNDSNIIFATQNLDGNINQKILDSGYQVIILETNDSNELESVIKENKVDLVVFDHYEIDYSFEKLIKENTKVKILSFDDTYEKHYCDYLFNQNIHAQKETYKGLVPKECEIFCGIKYALLRDEFVQIPLENEKKNTSNNFNILITLGGADSKNMTPIVIEALLLTKAFSYNANIVVGQANKHLKSIEKLIEGNEQFNLIINASNMAELMNKSDFVIMAGGSTIVEALYMKVPFLTITTAQNQEPNIKELIENDLAKSMGEYQSVTRESIKADLEHFIDKKLYKYYRTRLNSLEVGSFKVANEIENKITFREVNYTDKEYLFELANDETVRKSALNSSQIDFNDHCQWFEKKLKDIKNGKSHIYICEYNNNPIGQIRLDKKGRFWIVDISIDKRCRGKGFAKQIIDKISTKLNNIILLAFIKKENIASNNLFTKSGFIKSKSYKDLNFYLKSI